MLYRDEELIFSSRVLSNDTDTYKQRKVYCDIWSILFLVHQKGREPPRSIFGFSLIPTMLKSKIRKSSQLEVLRLTRRPSRISLAKTIIEKHSPQFSLT